MAKEITEEQRLENAEAAKRDQVQALLRERFGYTQKLAKRPDFSERIASVDEALAELGYTGDVEVDAADAVGVRVATRKAPERATRKAPDDK